MHAAALRMELRIPGVQSLKGKRRVLPADDVDEVIKQQASTMTLGLIGQLKDRAAFLDLARFVFAVNEGGRAELNRLKKAAGVRD